MVQRARIIHRAQLPSVHSVVVDGVEHGLGTLKELRANEQVREFLPKDLRVSIAWVHLDPEEVLAVHVHPVDSMLLICEGRGLAIGEAEGELVAGDVVLVPAGRRHGFVGKSAEGFWALSMQFDSRGLYEDLSDPWAKFVFRRVPMDGKDPLAGLLALNDTLCEHFSKHRIFTMADRGMLHDERTRNRFLDCLQVWSTHFQTLLRLRAALSDRPELRALAEAHLRDELRHDETLSRDRPDAKKIFDPVLEATSVWFVHRTSTLSEVGRVVLVHLVLESAAEIFYRRMGPLLETSEAKEHFAQHAAADQNHVMMGVEMLRKCRVDDWESLAEISRIGWEMLDSLFGRIATLILV